MARIAAIVLVLGMYMPETLLAGVVFEAGEIDRSAVKPGAYVEIIYGTGERDPVSGEWEELDTVKGYVKAVDVESLIIGERFWKKEIALDRIQKLTIPDTDGEMGRPKDKIDNAVATGYRNIWPFLGIAPGATIIFDDDNGNFSTVHAFAGYELGAGQFSASMEIGYGALIDALQWGVGVFSVNGNLHLMKKHRLNTALPFLSIGYTALMRNASLSLFNIGRVSHGGLIRAGACVWKCEIIFIGHMEYICWNSGLVLFDN